MRTTLLSLTALLALACGGAQQQANNAQGDDQTGSRAETQGHLTTSGDEVADNRNCNVEAVYFEYDSSELDTRARNTLDGDARCITQRGASAQITGMTDPRGTEEYNLALGDRRARTVERYLGNLGVEQGRLSVHSVGEERSSDDENAWSQDRRAEIQAQ